VRFKYLRNPNEILLALQPVTLANWSLHMCGATEDTMIDGVDDSAEYWRAVVESAGLGVWDYNTITGEKRYSSRWREIRHLLPSDPLPQSDEDWFAIVHPDDVASARYYTALINSGQAEEVSFEYRERGKSGGWIWIMCRGRALSRDRNGRATRFVGVDTDITDLKSAELARAVEAKQLEVAVTMAGIGIWKFDFDTGAATWDARLRSIYGVPPDLDPLPRDIWERFIHPDDLDRTIQQTVESQAKKADYSLEFRIIRNDGEIRHIRSRVGYPRDGLAVGTIIGVNWDVTEDLTRALRLEEASLIAEQRLSELNQAKTELERLSRHDPLTGLPNRRSLDEHLDRIASGTTPVSGFAFMVIDIDQFKKVNDTHGHAFGDKLLREVAAALDGEISPWGLLTRSGGDEFLALIDNFSCHDALMGIAAAAIRRAREVSLAMGHEVTVSIGIDVFKNQVTTRDQLFAHADKAMYRAKEVGGATAFVV
jgi:diguanylate cyclase (GGDEF)-like protein